MFGFDQRFVLLDVTPVENHFILNYMPSANGDDVRVYLYGLMQCRHPAEDMSIERMAHDLNLTPDQVMAAFRHWEFHGLVRRESDKPPVFRYLSANERALLGAEEHTDAAYLDFAESLAACFGEDRRLHGSENTMAYEWVEVLGLHPDVVLTMVRHLIHTRGKQFTFATTGQKTASRLAAEHVSTAEEAMAVLSADEKVVKGAKALLRRLGQKRREPSADEQALYRKWVVDWGFTPEAVEAACTQTTATISPNFGYIDGILARMKGNDATTAEAVQQTLQAEKQEAEPLKALLRTMRMTNVTVNPGTLALYQQMRAIAPEETILLAAEAVSRRGGDLSDVLSQLEGWQRLGLTEAERLKAFLSDQERHDALLRGLYRDWGSRSRPNQRDRELAAKWVEQWALDEEAIRYGASFATGKEDPMRYLDSILRSSVERGITTAEGMQAARAAFTGKKTGGKVTVQQQYTQRDYQEPDPSEIPDWLKHSLEEQHDKSSHTP